MSAVQTVQMNMARQQLTAVVVAAFLLATLAVKAQGDSSANGKTGRFGLLAQSTPFTLQSPSASPQLHSTSMTLANPFSI